MSLWTPSGEHPVDRPDRPAPGDATSPPPGPPSTPPASGPTSLDDLSPEERAEAEEFARQVDTARRQLLDAPVGSVVAQQALQFYELAALHLSQPEPKLDDARVAIDAFAAVVNGLGARLGEAEQPLHQALNQIQLAFVEVSRSVGGATETAPGS
ncbi:MAG TPA: hypothetical protein VIZ67_04600 [Acidimicrobiales bacterium]|jgi:hypothetical protein